MIATIQTVVECPWERQAGLVKLFLEYALYGGRPLPPAGSVYLQTPELFPSTFTSFLPPHSSGIYSEPGAAALCRCGDTAGSKTDEVPILMERPHNYINK